MKTQHRPTEELKSDQMYRQINRDRKRHTPFLVPRFRPLMSKIANLIPGLPRGKKDEFVNVKQPDVSLQHRASDSTRLVPLQKANKETECPDTSESLKAKRLHVFQRRLLKWYARHGRDLPWRRTRDPYCILVSEVMLQQTRVERVIPKYNEWLAAYPTFEALAAAPLQEAQKLWRPLGYNFRPERLHRIARYVVNQLDGKLPSTFEKLIALPGIGRYTAGAILSFAFHQDAPIVDTNVRRLIRRIFIAPCNPRHTALNREIWRLAGTLIPPGKAFIFNQALIDFGALVCTARDPACPSCIMRGICTEKIRRSKDW